MIRIIETGDGFDIDHRLAIVQLQDVVGKVPQGVAWDSVPGEADR